MFLMKRKILASFAGGLGAIGLLAVLEKERRSRQTERSRSKGIRSIRQVLSQEGEIAVLYVNAFDKSSPAMTGGVVMEDGRIFNFTYDNDALRYQEVEA